VDIADLQISRHSMNHIEFLGGILKPLPESIRPHRLAALDAFFRLEGQEFPGPLQAESAARKVLKEIPAALRQKALTGRQNRHA
jgi:hypothetical protein